MLFRLLKRLIKLTISLSALMLIVAALCITAFRFLIPELPTYKTDIEEWLSKEIKQEIKIKEISASVQGSTIVLDFKGTEILDNSKFALFQIKDLRVTVDIFDLIKKRKIEPTTVDIVGVELYVERSLDGKITVHGFQDLAVNQSESESSDLNEILNKLKQLNTQLRLVDSSVIFRDARYRQNYRVSDISAIIARDNDGPTLSGAFRLPENMGAQIRFFTKYASNQNNMKIPALEFYFHGSGIDFEGFPWKDELPVSQKIEKGKVDLQVWGRWDNSTVDSMQLRVNARDIAVNRQDKKGKDYRINLDEIGGSIAYNNSLYGWTLNMKDFIIRNNDININSHILQLWSKDSATEKKTSYGASFNNLEFLNIRALAKLFPEMSSSAKEVLINKGVSGSFYNGSFEFDLANGSINKYYLDGVINDFRYGRGKESIEFSNLKARIIATNKKGVINLNTTDGELKLGPLFRNSHELKTLNGQIKWSIGDNTIRLQSTPIALNSGDLNGTIKLAYNDLGKKDSGFLDITAYFKQLPAFAVKRYLPAKVMKPKALKWLDEAFRNGHVEDIKVLVHGTVNDFPFKYSQKGIFNIDAVAKNVDLNFNDKWPDIKNISGKLIFVGEGMTFKTTSGNLAKNLNIDRARIDVKDFSRTSISINGEVSGTSKGLQQYLIHTPLKFAKSNVLKDAQISGTVSGHLESEIPISDKIKTDDKVNATVKFSNCKLAWPKWKVDLHDLSGNLVVNENGIIDGDFIGKYRDKDAKINLSPLKNATMGKGVTIRTSGIFSLARFIPADYSKVSRIIEGDSNWKVKIDAPYKSEKGVVITALSDMKGTEIKMPQPFNKKQQKKLPSKVIMRFTEKTEITAQMGKIASVFAQIGQNSSLEKLVLNIGSGKVKKTKTQGVFVNGKINILNIDTWNQYLSKLGFIGNGDNNICINSINLLAKKIIYKGREITNTILMVNKNKGLTRIELKNNWIDGYAEIPDSSNKDKTVKIRLQKLEYHPSKKKDEQKNRNDIISKNKDLVSINPATIPPIDIIINKIKSNGINMGALKLKSIPLKNGMEINKLEIKGEKLKIKANGSWLKNKGGERTSMQVSANSKDIGHIVRALGFEDTIRKGETKMEVNLLWPGNPADLSLKNLKSSLDFTIKDGQLPSVKPGAGRIIGLLSFDVIFRRLTLDFSDFFSEGFAFDYVKGKMKTDNGNAQIEKIEIEGTQANIAMKGRIGLVARDYDQIMVVTPKASSTLPMIAGLAAGTGAGVGVLILQKLFKSPLDSITRSRYKITGTWEKPKIEKSEIKVQGPKYSPDKIMSGEMPIE